MIQIDTALVDFTERCCQWFQRLTGRTNVWIAFQLTNLSIIVYFVWAALSFWRVPGTPRILVGLFCGGVLFVLTQTIFKVPVETSESHAYRRVSKGLRNPRRVRDAPLRMAFLTLSVVLLSPVLYVSSTLRLPLLLLSYILIALTTVVLYVLACDPLPPCRGRVSVWVRGLRQARVSAPRSAISFQHSAISFQRSAFSTQRSAFAR